MKYLVLLTALAAAPFAFADTYTVFDISGTDSQRSTDLGFGESGCHSYPVCTTYVPGTFSGTALIDVSTDTITGATITTFGGDPIFTGSYAASAVNPNIGSGLNLIQPLYNSVTLIDEPVLYLGFDLSSDSVSGSVPTFAAGPSIDQAGVSFTSDMVGTLTPVLTTTIHTMAAPEIDPASAASGITLLLGGLMVLRGRRPEAKCAKT